MEFFRKQTNINFLGFSKWAGVLSAALIIASFASIAFKGINWGLDFTGGYSIHANFKTAPDMEVLRGRIADTGLRHPKLITFGSSKDIMIRLMPKEDMKKQNLSDNQKTEQDLLKSKIDGVIKPMKGQILSVNYIGPEVGAQLAERGLLALFVAIIVTMIYIAMRFEIRFAISSAIALAHDPIIILGIFSFFQLEFGLISLGAILAIIGYSLNDTVVVYDRIRENFRKMRKTGVEEVVNRAINDTLSRTIMTSGLTLIVVVVLFLIGGPSVHNFSLALIIGVIVGTYSSIYIAGSLAVILGLDRKSLIPQAKPIDHMP